MLSPLLVAVSSILLLSGSCCGRGRRLRPRGRHVVPHQVHGPEAELLGAAGEGRTGAHLLAVRKVGQVPDGGGRGGGGGGRRRGRRGGQVERGEERVARGRGRREAARARVVGERLHSVLRVRQPDPRARVLAPRERFLRAREHERPLAGGGLLVREAGGTSSQEVKSW